MPVEVVGPAARDDGRMLVGADTDTDCFERCRGAVDPMPQVNARSVRSVRSGGR